MTEDKALFGRNIVFEHSQLGKIELKYISWGDTGRIVEILGEKDPRKFAELIVHNQIISPKMELVEMQALPEAELKEVCLKIIDNTPSIRKHFKGIDDRIFFDDFRSAFDESYSDRKKQKEIIERQLHRHLAESFANLTPIFNMPDLKFMSEALKIPPIAIPDVVFKIPPISIPNLALNIPQITISDVDVSHISEYILKTPLSFNIPIETTPDDKTTALINEASSQTISRLLSDIDSELEQKRLGAWQTLRGEGLDKVSQATHSMREVLRQLLDILAPEEDVPSAQWYARPAKPPYVTRRMRVRYSIGGPTAQVISESTLDLIEAIADFVDAAYNKLSSKAHSKGDTNEVSAEAILQACESVILMILGDRRN